MYTCQYNGGLGLVICFFNKLSVHSDKHALMTNLWFLITILYLYLFFHQVSDYRNTIIDVPVGILFEDTDLQPPNSLHLTSSIGIILEGQVVMDKMQDLPQAIFILFGLIYALELNYPKSLANTFDFIQRVLMSMGQNALKPRVQSLANQLYA